MTGEVGTRLWKWAGTCGKPRQVWLQFSDPASSHTAVRQRPTNNGWVGAEMRVWLFHSYQLMVEPVSFGFAYMVGKSPTQEATAFTCWLKCGSLPASVLYPWLLPFASFLCCLWDVRRRGLQMWMVEWIHAHVVHNTHLNPPSSSPG